MDFEDGKIFYTRNSKYVFGTPSVIFLRSVKGKRKYREEIKKRDWLIEIGIKQNQQCPHCGKISEYANTCPFSFDDQIAMWSAVFLVKVLAREKKRQIRGLWKLLRALEQTKITDLFEEEKTPTHS